MGGHAVTPAIYRILGKDLGALLELSDNAGEDEEADGPVEVLERNAAAYCCRCIRHLTTSPRHHCEPAEGRRKKCKHCSVMKHVCVPGAVTAAVKFFAAKIRGAQRNGSPEAPAETVIGEIPVATSPVAAPKSSLKRRASPVEEIRGNKQVCLGDNSSNDTGQAEADLFFSPWAE
ncbi:predicted protein [Histoplasma mississippiense (nom. inval.)]|uniref:predicted protein n=1 Tax=Ajellomyces capsulatus (strain NAm1 / WU24) TaxID=2059318 RepID=UPI000157B2A5|nr:predicted protein [Histoplasma mississippiense (nom. inval.)]EDN02270.1 predicted protein [Histoplasma mississippiense (nom. inval.)]